jgi:RNA 2',3'-cyclic 3'-phosphodiesterase
MRLFLGIAIPPDAAEEIARRIEHLVQLSPELRWSSPQTWHITLQFLSKADETQYSCLVDRLREVEFQGFQVRTVSTGFFDRAGVFFVEVAQTPELHALQNRIVAATRRCGFMPEDRPYSPHITLARSRGRTGSGPLAPLKAALRSAPQIISVEFAADEFLLYESVPQPRGSRYDVRARFPLSEG